MLEVQSHEYGGMKPTEGSQLQSEQGGRQPHCQPSTQRSRPRRSRNALDPTGSTSSRESAYDGRSEIKVLFYLERLASPLHAAVLPKLYHPALAFLPHKRHAP